MLLQCFASRYKCYWFKPASAMNIQISNKLLLDGRTFKRKSFVKDKNMGVKYSSSDDSPDVRSRAGSFARLDIEIGIVAMKLINDNYNICSE